MLTGGYNCGFFIWTKCQLSNVNIFDRFFFIQEEDLVTISPEEEELGEIFRAIYSAKYQPPKYYIKLKKMD